MGCGGSSSSKGGASTGGAKKGGPKPVFAYWGIIGRGDVGRILLHHLGVDFEDRYFGPGESTNPKDCQWPGSKPKLGMAFPNLPYWQEGDTIHAETLAVLRSICRSYSPEYLGRNPKEQAYADSFSGTIYGDFGPWLGPAFFAPVTDKNALITQAKGIVATISKCIGNKQFIAGDVTYCDFIAYWALKYFNRFDESIVKSDPKVVAYVAKMHGLKGVAAAEAMYDSKLALLTPDAAWMKDHPFKG